jgi:hypothetical protein
VIADGLYIVDYKGISAAFVIEGGRVTRCAPVLRRRLEFWMTIGKRYEMPQEIEHDGPGSTVPRC